MFVIEHVKNRNFSDTDLIYSQEKINVDLCIDLKSVFVQSDAMVLMLTI